MLLQSKSNASSVPDAEQPCKRNDVPGSSAGDSVAEQQVPAPVAIAQPSKDQRPSTTGEVFSNQKRRRFDAQRTVRHDHSLSIGARFLYCELEDLAGPTAGTNERCFHSQQALAGILGSSVRSIEDWMRELRDAEYVRVVRRQCGNRYELFWADRLPDPQPDVDRERAACGSKPQSDVDRRVPSPINEPKKEPRTTSTEPLPLPVEPVSPSPLVTTALDLGIDSKAVATLRKLCRHEDPTVTDEEIAEVLQARVMAELRGGTKLRTPSGWAITYIPQYFQGEVWKAWRRAQALQGAVKPVAEACVEVSPVGSDADQFDRGLEQVDGSAAVESAGSFNVTQPWANVETAGAFVDPAPHRQDRPWPQCAAPPPRTEDRILRLEGARQPARQQPNRSGNLDSIGDIALAVRGDLAALGIEVTNPSGTANAHAGGVSKCAFGAVAGTRMHGQNVQISIGENALGGSVARREARGQGFRPRGDADVVAEGEQGFDPKKCMVLAAGSLCGERVRESVRLVQRDFGA